MSGGESEVAAAIRGLSAQIQGLGAQLSQVQSEVRQNHGEVREDMRKHQELVQQQHDQTTSALSQTRDHLRQLMKSVISELRKLRQEMDSNHQQQTRGQMNTHQQINQQILVQLQGQVDQLQQTVTANKSQLDALLRQLSKKLDAVQWMSCTSQAGRMRSRGSGRPWNPRFAPTGSGCSSCWPA